MKQTQAQTISWIKTGQNSSAQLRVAYRGPLSGPDLRLHYGFDGWQEPVDEVKLERSRTRTRRNRTVSSCRSYFP